MVIVALVAFLVWVNFLPFLGHMVLGERLAWPVDGGLAWRDGRALLGPHKTWRGVAASVLGGAAAGPLLGMGAVPAALAASLSMLGDLLTSLVKRRLHEHPGRPVLGLDQALEGLLPLPLLTPALGAEAWQAAAALALFVPINHLGARFIHYVLDTPPIANYPRIIRVPTRVREWRACHQPMARWHHLFNFENFFYYRILLSRTFKATGLYDRGVRNVLAVQVRPSTLHFPDLPAAFDGYRILLLTDLHLDGLPALAEVLAERLGGLEVDLCLVGGDVRMELYGPMAPSVRLLRRLLDQVRTADGVFGVLGNHDCIEMLPELEQAGIRMLVNDAHPIRRGADSLWLVGVDDPHFYRCHDLPTAFAKPPAEAFKVFLAHSPEVYREAADFGTHLYLCGHTHGGQICLPGIGPVFTHSRAPRFTAAGSWTYRSMTGYTSRGAGASGVPVRFHCPGEVPLLTLRSGQPPAA